ncbi:hypothetical protein F5B22DRAFT_28577 [Xylaria bambusicola]|uniref:uncharacterized protein n=1 Tax=Xylaria bambusicola TaxID=326684 RepID=UPI002007BB95|nr:uncharacterized protein F5B22DRAFT_28577 [Xylaria bambusicola]KAI0528255.1 hypothetical protein F5B22DRAFT_28577 [Xylaria bambusicola]
MISSSQRTAACSTTLQRAASQSENRLEKHAISGQKVTKWTTFFTIMGAPVRLRRLESETASPLSRGDMLGAHLCQLFDIALPRYYITVHSERKNRRKRWDTSVPLHEARILKSGVPSNSIQFMGGGCSTTEGLVLWCERCSASFSLFKNPFLYIHSIFGLSLYGLYMNYEKMGRNLRIFKLVFSHASSRFWIIHGNTAVSYRRVACGRWDTKTAVVHHVARQFEAKKRGTDILESVYADIVFLNVRNA